MSFVLDSLLINGSIMSFVLDSLLINGSINRANYYIIKVQYILILLSILCTSAMDVYGHIHANLTACMLS